METYAKNLPVSRTYDEVSVEEQRAFLSELTTATKSLKSPESFDIEELKAYLDLESKRRLIRSSSEAEQQSEPWYKQLYNLAKQAGMSFKDFINQIFECVRSHLPKILDHLNTVATGFSIAAMIAKVIKSLAESFAKDPNKKVNAPEVLAILL